MSRCGVAVLAAAALLGGCGGDGGVKSAGRAPAGGKPADPPRPRKLRAPKAIVAADWHAQITSSDRKRLRTWRDAWTTALARLPRDPRVAREGVLLQPDAGLDGAAPPQGDYRCRVIKLGAQQKPLPDFVAYPPFSCRVGGGSQALSFAKLDGSQRPVGTLYPETPDRMVFLGSMVLGDETRAQGYGRDPERDIIGMVERIGPQRWRLVMPYPHWESLVDVMELVPKR